VPLCHIPIPAAPSSVSTWATSAASLAPKNAFSQN